MPIGHQPLIIFPKTTRETVSTIKVGVAGAAGYTGGELIRILIHHPQVQIVWLHSTSSAGKPVHSVHHDLLGDTDLVFSAEPDHGQNEAHKADVVFLCLGHGAARKYLEQYPHLLERSIIDLSQDFRLGEEIGGQRFTYGLCDWNAKAVAESTHVANPGCFATAIQLALLPLVPELATGAEVHIHATTGSTGAGQSLSETSHFSWRQNNLSIYKAFEHQHEKEINRTLNASRGTMGTDTYKTPPFELNFIPARGSFTRGILASCYTKVEGSLEHWQQVYQNYYAESPFVHLTDRNPDLKQVVNTNKCLLYLEKHGQRLLIVSMIDNLLKGASGQAVENMNLMFGLPRSIGLGLKATGF